MSYEDRRVLCADLEQYRQRALIVYVTSHLGDISLSALPEFLDQIHRVPPDATRLDLLVVSDGGDGDLAWQVMPILRERFQEVAVLVPAHAFSAATLLALGADRIVMHPSGRLGPVDPQFRKDPYPADAGGRQCCQWFNYDELQPAMETGLIEIVLGSQGLRGTVVRVPPGADRATLEGVLAALTAALRVPENLPC